VQTTITSRKCFVKSLQGNDRAVYAGFGLFSDRQRPINTAKCRPCLSMRGRTKLNVNAILQCVPGVATSREAHVPTDSINITTEFPAM